MFKSNNKVKKILFFSVCFSAFFISGTSTSGVIKKVVSSSVRGVSSSQVRKTAGGSALNTWSSRRSNMQDVKNKDISLQSQKKLDNSEFIHGKFTDPSGNERVFPVYSGFTEEGLKRQYIKTQNGDEIKVVHIGDDKYSKTLSLDELKVFNQVNHGGLHTAFDKLGRGRFVLMLSNGDNEVAYQPDTGILRSVLRDKNKIIHLGHQVDMTSLSDEVRNEIFSIIRDTSRYAAPVTGPMVSMDFE